MESMNAHEFAVVSTTVGDETDAMELARRIVEERLAACVQHTVIKSTYRWEGRVEIADEHLLMAKTKACLTGKLAAFIKANHSYEVPEIVVTPVTGGHAAYLEWIAVETQ